MNAGRAAGHRSDGDEGPALDAVTAVVLTHMRPGLAGDVTRVADRCRRARSRPCGGRGQRGRRSRRSGPRGQGQDGPPAGQHRTRRWLPCGDDRGVLRPSTQWAYLCEDDIGLFALPRPRLADLVGRVGRLAGATGPDRSRGGLRQEVRRARAHIPSIWCRRRVVRRVHAGRRGLLGRDPRVAVRCSTPVCFPTRMVLRPGGLRLLLPGPRGRFRGGRRRCRRRQVALDADLGRAARGLADRRPDDGSRGLAGLLPRP